ncbi:DUF3159 domain-containing protein [Patescibacteria group bacterium]
MSSKFDEIIDELKKVFFGKYNILDFVLPPVIYFLGLQLFSQALALLLSLAFSLLLFLWRLKNKESLMSLLLGLSGAVAVYIYSLYSGNITGFFLPDIATDAIISSTCLISIVIKKPLVSYTSYISRRWPINWYWHPKVRPAYSEVTILWLIFFSFKFVVGLLFLNQGNVKSLAIVNIITGWPGTIVLLIISYLWGMKRLNDLKGPSVSEFKRGKKPPWKGQRKGF